MYSIVALLTIACMPQDPTTVPDTMPGKRLTDFMTAFNTTDEKQVDAMISRTFAKSALRILSKEEWTSRIAGAFKVAPISIDAVLKSTDSILVVRLKSKSILPLGIRLDLESEVPYGILGAKMGPPAELLDSTAPKKYTNWKTLGNLAELIRSDNKLPALCVAYEQLGQKPEVEVAGFKSTIDKETIETDDRLLVGGIGKAMTATLIAKMVELKKLSWDSTLVSVLPGIKMSDAYKGVTVDQLLHHLAHIPQRASITGDTIEQLAAKGSSATDIRMAFVTNILSQDPEDESNGQSTYDDADFVVAGFMIEKLIGKSYEWLMQRYVFDPMKMSTAMIAPLGAPEQVGSPGSVFGHMQSENSYAPFQIPASTAGLMLAPAGTGISCSLGDILKFSEFHLKGLNGDPHVLTADSYKRIHSLLNGKGSAAGWTINPSFAGEPCQSIATTDGTFYADLTIWPASNMIIVAVTNAGTMRHPSPTLQAVLAVRDRLEKKD